MPAQVPGRASEHPQNYTKQSVIIWVTPRQSSKQPTVSSTLCGQQQQVATTAQQWYTGEHC
jgi:hypothetical protein